MSKLADRIRARPNDAPLETEYMLDEAADALDECERALILARDYGDTTDDAQRAVRAALAKLEGAK